MILKTRRRKKVDGGANGKVELFWEDRWFTLNGLADRYKTAYVTMRKRYSQYGAESDVLCQGPKRKMSLLAFSKKFKPESTSLVTQIAYGRGAIRCEYTNKIAKLDECFVCKKCGINRSDIKKLKNRRSEHETKPII